MVVPPLESRIHVPDGPKFCSARAALSLDVMIPEAVHRVSYAIDLNCKTKAIADDNLLENKVQVNCGSDACRLVTTPGGQNRVTTVCTKKIP